MATRLLVSTRKGLFLMAPSASVWEIERTAFLGEPVTIALHDAPGRRLVAALNLGHFGVKVRASEDRGKTWEELPSPVYPPKPDSENAWEQEAGKSTPWSLVQIWSLESGDPEQPGSLWCGTIPGGLFRSADGGRNWELVRSLWDRRERRRWFGGGYDHAGVHSICVDPRDPRRVTLGVSCGGVWHTDDAGESWEPRTRGMFAEYMPPEHREDPAVQDPHRVVQCPAEPDYLWAQHHNGVFFSRDAARTWTTIQGVPPSVFGFAAAVHPFRPDTAWFVPAIKDEFRYPVGAAMAVARTRDGGKTWQELRIGLPQRHAYHLVYRHGLDVDATGERLAIGSTTGGLWFSEDQGDRWVCATRDLPPIYAVRFVEFPD